MEVVAGVLLAVFLGFIANRLGYLSVHKVAPKPPSTGRSGGASGSGQPKDHF